MDGSALTFIPKATEGLDHCQDIFRKVLCGFGGKQTQELEEALAPWQGEYGKVKEKVPGSYSSP